MFVDGLIFILITKKINFNKFNNSELLLFDSEYS